jgi:hypothetical protein
MKILAIARIDPLTTLDKIKPHLEAEVRIAWKLYKQGIIREMYGCQDRQLGVVFVLECDGIVAAHQALDELPLVREKFIDFETIPLGPFAYIETLYKDYQPPRPG